MLLSENKCNNFFCFFTCSVVLSFFQPIHLSKKKVNSIGICELQASPVFTFANQAGLDMLETTLVALQDIMLDKILDEAGRKILCSEFSKIMQQVFT